MMLEQLAIELPQQEANFLAAFAKEKGITISDAVARLVQFLERTQSGSNPDIMSLIGVLNGPPSMWDYLSGKYQ
jgi:hypothetical protein